MSDRLLMFVSAGEIGYAGYVTVTVINTESGYEKSRTRWFPLTFGSMEMPPSPSRGDVMVRRRDVSLDLTRSPDSRHIRCRFDGFDDVCELYVNLELHFPPEAHPRTGEREAARDTSERRRTGARADARLPARNVPEGVSAGEYSWMRDTSAEQPGGFVCAAHVPCMRTTGAVVLGAYRCEFSDDECFSSYEWIRAVTPGRVSRTALTVCGGTADGSLLGISLSEDGVMVHDSGHMITAAPFVPSVNADGPALPFSLSTPGGLVEMRFTPYADHSHRSSAMGLTAVNERLIFGTASGVCRPSASGAVSFSDLNACLRMTDTRW